MLNSIDNFKQKGMLKIMIAGHGGQGVLDLGNFIAYQALKNGDHVVYTPTYGPETRGGKVRCWVTTSDGEIDSPVAEVLDVLFILNKPSMDFIHQLRPGGLLVYNISIINRDVDRSDIISLPLPCNDLACDLEQYLDADYLNKIDPTKALNCIMYGGFLSYTGWEYCQAHKEAEDVFNYLYKGNKKRFIQLNMAGVKRGFKFIEQLDQSLNPA